MPLVEQNMAENTTVKKPNLNFVSAFSYQISFAESYMPANEFNLVNSVVCDGIQKEKEMGISTLAFDSHEELLWIGTKSGHVRNNPVDTCQKRETDLMFNIP